MRLVSIHVGQELFAREKYAKLDIRTKAMKKQCTCRSFMSEGPAFIDIHVYAAVVALHDTLSEYTYQRTYSPLISHTLFKILIEAQCVGVAKNEGPTQIAIIRYVICLQNFTTQSKPSLWYVNSSNRIFY